MKKNSKSPKTQEQFEVKLNPKNSMVQFLDYDFKEIDSHLTSLNVINPDLPSFPLYKLITVDVDGLIDVTVSNDLAYLLNIYKVTCDFVGIYVLRNENSIYHTLKIF